VVRSDDGASKLPCDLKPHELGILNLRRRIVKGFAMTLVDVNAMVHANQDDGEDGLRSIGALKSTEQIAAQLAIAKKPIQKSYAAAAGASPPKYWGIMHRFVDDRVCVVDVLSGAAQGLPPASQRMLHEYLSGSADVIVALNGGVTIDLKAAQVLQMKRIEPSHKRSEFYMYRPSEFPHLSMQQARQIFQPAGNTQVKLDARLTWTGLLNRLPVSATVAFASSVPLVEPVSDNKKKKKSTTKKKKEQQGDVDSFLFQALVAQSPPFPWPYFQFKLGSEWSDDVLTVTLRNVTVAPNLRAIWSSYLTRLEASEEQAELKAEKDDEPRSYFAPMRISQNNNIIHWKIKTMHFANENKQLMGAASSSSAAASSSSSSAAAAAASVQ